MLKLGSCFSQPYWIAGYAPSCTASIYQKILWFDCDLIYAVITSSSIISGTEQIWIDYRNFWA